MSGSQAVIRVDAVSALAKGDFRFYSLLSSAKTPAEFAVAILSALAELGLDSFSFKPVGVAAPKQLSSLPEELLQQYQRKGYGQYDLVAHHATTQTAPVYRSTIADYVGRSPLHLELNVKFLDLCQLMSDHGYLDSYNIPYTTPMGINCLFSVSRKGLEPEPFRTWMAPRQALIYLLGDIIASLAISHYAGHFFGAKALGRRAGITPKQLAMLNKVAKENVTLKGAADRMHISLDTANKHIAAIKAALGAKTQAAAVYRAMVAGLIEIDSGEWE